MKKYLMFVLVVLIFLIYPLCCASDPLFDIMFASVDEGAACTTSRFSEDGTDSTRYIGDASDDLYLATKFVYSGADGKQICSSTARVGKHGTPNRSFYAYIYTYNGVTEKPVTIIGTSDAVNGTSFNGSSIEFVFSTPSTALSNGTTYCYAVGSSSYDASNYAIWYLTNTATTKRVLKSDTTTGSDFSYSTSSYSGSFELFSE